MTAGSCRKRSFVINKGNVHSWASRLCRRAFVLRMEPTKRPVVATPAGFNPLMQGQRRRRSACADSRPRPRPKATPQDPRARICNGHPRTVCQQTARGRRLPPHTNPPSCRRADCAPLIPPLWAIAPVGGSLASRQHHGHGEGRKINSQDNGL